MKQSRHFFTLAAFLLSLNFFGCPSPGGPRAPGAKNDKRNKRMYDGTFVKMYLRDVGDLEYEPTDSVAWAVGSVNQQDLGRVAIFFLEGEGRNLSDPNIQVGYFTKKFSGQETMDALFKWVEDTYVHGPKPGVIVQPRKKMPTYGGVEAEVMTISIPTEKIEGTDIQGKWVSYAYIDRGPYYIGFVLTAFDELRYERIYKAFLDLVTTYEPA